jgi:hypothetical protein
MRRYGSVSPPEGTSCYDLGKRIVIPTQTTNQQFNFRIRLEVPGKGFFFADYPVLVASTVPIQADPNDNATALPQNANSYQLQVMRAAALDEALWNLHLQMISRAGTGANLSGAFPSAPLLDSIPTAGAYLLLASRTGHLPAYPPGTYDHDIHPVGGPAAPPADFIAENDARYNADPYAENAMRVLNYLVANLSPVFIAQGDEADDGTTAIPGTNDGVGLTPSVYMHWSWIGLPLAGLAESGLPGTVVLGRPLEHIVQQIVDYVVFAQIDVANANQGGWWYLSSPAPVTAVTGEDILRGATLGLKSAVDHMGGAGVYANRRVRDRLGSFLKHFQDPTSKLVWFSLNNCSNPGNFSETGDALFAAGGILGWSAFAADDEAVFATDYAGIPISKGEARQIFDDYLDAAIVRWVSLQQDCNTWNSGFVYNDGGATFLRTDHRGNIWSMFAFANALRSLPNAQDYAVVNGHIWNREFSTYLIRNQHPDGSWLDAQWPQGSRLVGPDIYGPVLSTAYSALTVPEPGMVASLFAGVLALSRTRHRRRREGVAKGMTSTRWAG